jgi:nucleotide-binding universal stress UspA family protein
MRKILVGLDLTEMDAILIEYAAFLGYAFDSIEEVIFFHNIKFDYPDEAAAIVDRLEKPLIEVVREELNGRIASHFEQKDHKITTRLIVEEKDATAGAVARTSRVEGVDLILLGKKDTYIGSGILIDRLLNINELKTPVLLTPEYAFHRISKILVPVDFSENARSALHAAQRWRESLPAELSCLHVYTIPIHFFPYIPMDDMHEAMERDAEKSYRKFVQKIEPKPEGAFLPARDRGIAQAIQDYAVRHNHDLVVVGAKGTSALASLFVGSVTQRLLKLKMHIPVLVVKH